MNRNRGAGMRLGVSVIVFVVAFFGVVATTSYAVAALQQGKGENAALLFLLLVWALLAYFPARQAYIATTYKEFPEGLHCEKCGYDLRGNQGGVCSECGRAIQVAELLRQHGRTALPTQDGLSKRRRRALPWIVGGVVASVSIIIMLVPPNCLHSNARHVALEDFERTTNPFFFVQWSRGFELAKEEPNAVFAVLNGTIQARFTFYSENRRILESVGVYDLRGRPWFEIDLVNGRYDVNSYSHDNKTTDIEPVATISDTDADGVTDRKRNWVDGEELCAEAPDTWKRCED